MKRVVITGIGAISSNGIGRDEYKKAVIAGKSGISRIDRFDASKLDCKIAGQVRLNDDIFTKKEMRNIPRTGQLAILAATEAFQDAKIDPAALSPEQKNRIGVLLGTGGGSAEFMEHHYEMYYGTKDLLPSLYVISAGTAGGLSSELSIRFGLRGRSHVITTGCTSSSDAIGYAFQTIQTGKLDVAVTGGADAPLAEGIMQGFCLMKVLTTKWNDQPEKGSRPFCKDRDGFVLGEGSWMFILEEMEHAKKRGARMYAEILGYGSSCEAYHAVRLEEGGLANVQALNLAMDDAKLSADKIDYVSLHGTSTQMNDKVETNVLKRYFGDRAKKIPMSAIKSMIGHPQGASGASGLAATLLAMEDNMIHPTMNLEFPDPDCDLDYIPLVAREKKLEYILCNTLGFGSKCSVLVLRNMLRDK